MSLTLPFVNDNIESMLLYRSSAASDAITRSAANDLTTREMHRQRGELLIDPEHLAIAAALNAGNADHCPCCSFPLSQRERLAWRKVDGVYVVTHAGCAP